jgi:hypothetical protein
MKTTLIATPSQNCQRFNGMLRSKVSRVYHASPGPTMKNGRG